MVVVETHEEWMILNKPAGVSVFPRHDNPDSDCLLKRLISRHPEQDQPFPDGFAGGIAHRLDIPTSGMVLAARSPAALMQIRSYFTNKLWSKKYLLISAVHASWMAHICDLAIAHHPKSRKKMVVQRHARTHHRGKWYAAETRFQYLGPCNNGHLYQATMRSGVMHQIRVHAAAIGIPLLGDELYGGAIAPPSFEVGFALHHCGMSCPAIETQPIDPPSWWPEQL